MNIYRGENSAIRLRLRADEALGLIGDAHIADYFDEPGAISLLEVATGMRRQVLMGEDESGFFGEVSLASLADGEYILQGRVCDLVGNCTILSAIAHPVGTERIEALSFNLVSGFQPELILEIDESPSVLLAIEDVHSLDLDADDNAEIELEADDRGSAYDLNASDAVLTELDADDRPILEVATV